MPETPSLTTSRIGRSDTSPTSGNTFIPPCESVQSGLAPLPMQSSPFTAFRDSAQDQEQVQSDPRSHLLFGVSIDQPLIGSNGAGALAPRGGLVKGKDAQNRFGGASLLPAPFSSAGPEMPMSPGIMSTLDDNSFMTRGSSGWPMLPAAPPVRTFTKVVYSAGRHYVCAEARSFTAYVQNRL